MACKYIYNGVDYTKSEVLKLIDTNKSNFIGMPNGFTYENEIVLNSDRVNSSVAIHEFGHLYLDLIKEINRKIYDKGIKLAQSKEAQPYRDFVLKNQPNLKGESLENEILTQAIGDNGAKIVGEQGSKTFKDWLTKLWEFIKGEIGLADTSVEDFRNLTLDEFAKRAATDLLSGKSIDNLMNSETGTVGDTFDIRPDAQEGVFTKFDLTEFNNNLNLDNEIKKMQKTTKADEGGVTLNLDGSTYKGGGLVVPIVSKNFKNTKKAFTKKEVKDFIELHSDKINNDIFKVSFFKFENQSELSVDLNIVVAPKFRDVALAFGKLAGQKALFDLTTFKDVPTGETGANTKEFTTEEVRSIADSLVKGEMPKFSVSETEINPNLTNDGEGNYVFYHYSHLNLDEISPKKSGSNPRNITSRTELSVMGSVGGLSMYYVKTTNKESNIGSFGSMVKVPYDKVYNISKDENGYEEEAYNRFKQLYPNRAFDGNVSTAWITKIAEENGYDMTIVKWKKSDYRAQSTKVLKPVEKQIVERNVLISDFTDYGTANKPKPKPRFSVGFVQTKQKPEGTQITLSNVDDQIQGKGVGTQMYKQAATEAVSKGGTLISDFNNKGAEGVWSNLREQGLTEPMTMGDKVVERIKTTPDSFDINGEPSVSDVITYIQSKNYEGQTLSDVEVNEVRNVMLGTTMTSSEELFRALKRAFTPNGMYNPSEQSLMASGVYSKVEARRLLDSEELQLAAYEMMHKLKNSDTVLNESEVDNKYITVTSSFNSLGTLRKSNPYINKKNATEILGGIKNETSFYNQAEANDLDFANTKFEELSKLTKLNKTKIEGGRTRTETNLDTLKTRLEETLTLPSDNKLTKNLNYLLEIPNDVWNLEFKNVRTILEDIEANAVDIGLDLSNLNEESYDKTPAEVKSLLNSVRNFVTLQNESTFEILLGEYITFFDLSETPNVVTLDLNEATVKKTLVYSDTELDSYTLFSEHGLLPLGNNVYQKVNANKTFEQAKEIIYQTLQSGNNIIPKSAFKTEYDITDLKNEEFVKEDITNYVNEEIKKIDNNANYDADVLRNMVLFSKYFNTQLNNDKSTPTITGEIDLINNYPQNAEYLKTEFIADFNKKMLKEKVKNSKKYNNFYKHFDISSQGIELINTDPITRREITPYLTDDLVNHFKLKKNGINIVENNDVPIDTSNDIVLRNYYSNYPKALPLYKETYQMDNGTLISNSDKSPFIRVDEGVFEHIETVGNKALYSMLNTNDTNFKTYSRSYITPTLGEISKFNITAGVKADKKVNNLYSTAQDTEITNEIDNC